MVDQLRSFASEVTRVAREVGTEGKLGGQAEVQGVAGTWKDLTDTVNFMAGEPDRPGPQHRRGHHRRRQRRPLQEDHRRRQGRDPRAEEHHQHDGRPAQLVRLARSRAWPARSAPKASSAARPRCKGVAGTWKDLTDTVNSMAGTSPPRCATSPRSPPPSPTATSPRRSPSTCKGEILELKNTINTMVDQLGVVRLRGHPRGPRGRHRRQARRPGRGARAWPAPGRTSPTPSTPWPATSPARCATSPRSPPPSPTATSPRRSPSTSRARSSS